MDRNWSQLNELGLTQGTGPTFDVEIIYAVGCRYCLREWNEFIEPSCVCDSNRYWMIWTTDFHSFISLHLPKHNLVITKREIELALIGGGEDD